MRIAICLPQPQASPLSLALEQQEHRVRIVSPTDLHADGPLRGAHVLVVPADARVLTAAVVAACDRQGVRIVPVVAGERSRRLATGFGLVPVTELTAQAVLHATEQPVPEVVTRAPGGVIAVWSAAGSPGRTTLALSLATELAGSGRTCLIDADTHAPSLAQVLGLDEDAPGVAGACRAAASGAMDAASYDRIRQTLPVTGDALDVFVGLNRASRWPELRADRLTQVLACAQSRADYVVVDVASALETDEALLTDIASSPARNAATLATLGVATRIVAVLQPDPVSVGRFVRAHAQLRQLQPHTPMTIVVNRFRASAAGIDGRGQVRRTIERFTQEQDVHFVAQDEVNVDRALLEATPAALLNPRSPFVGAVKDVVRSLLQPRTQLQQPSVVSQHATSSAYA